MKKIKISKNNFKIKTIEEMNKLITDKQNIIVKNTYSCYCYDDCKKKTDYFYIKGEYLYSNTLIYYNYFLLNNYINCILFILSYFI